MKKLRLIFALFLTYFCVQAQNVRLIQTLGRFEKFANFESDLKGQSKSKTKRCQSSFSDVGKRNPAKRLPTSEKDDWQRKNS